MKLEERVGKAVLRCAEEVMKASGTGDFYASEPKVQLQKAREIVGKDQYFANILVDELRKIEESYISRDDVRSAIAERWIGGPYYGS